DRFCWLTGDRFNQRSRIDAGLTTRLKTDSLSPISDARATDSPLDDFDLIHRDALRDSDNMTLSQRLLVADAHRMIRDECAGRAEVGSSDVSGSSSEAAQAIAAHSHLRWPDLSREWIRRQEARIVRVDWESRLPVVLGPRKSRLSLFTRKQQKLLDEARKMDGVPDLSSLLKGKLQLLSKKSIPADVQGSTSSDADRASKEGAPGLVNEDVGAEPPASGPKKKKKSKKSRGKATEELPLEEIASLDETSEGLEARKEKGGKKRPYEGATSSADHGEAPAVGREGAAEGPFESNRSEAAPEDRPRKKKKKRSIEAEPRPSDAEAGLVEVVAGGSVSLETPPEERKVSARGSDPVASERSVPDSSARKGSRSEGSTIRRGKIEFPDRVEFFYNETTPLILNPLSGVDASNSWWDEGDVTIGRPLLQERSDGSMIQLGSSEKLAQARLKAIERVRAEHKKANEKAAEEKEILRNENLEEVPGKDNPEIGNTPVREEETRNVDIEDPVLVSDSSSEGREGEEEEDDRVEETSSLQPVEEEKPDEVGNRDVPPPLAGDSLVSIPARVEDPTVAATEDPVGPSALGTPEEVGQDSAP
ncbi:LOW QUALITY PROTEIN: hypothetical protein HID58_042369, partial [Brassica napus]